jgi:hypothetical protein
MQNQRNSRRFALGRHGRPAGRAGQIVPLPAPVSTNFEFASWLPLTLRHLLPVEVIMQVIR